MGGKPSPLDQSMLLHGLVLPEKRFDDTFPQMEQSAGTCQVGAATSSLAMYRRSCSFPRRIAQILQVCQWLKRCYSRGVFSAASQKDRGTNRRQISNARVNRCSTCEMWQSVKSKLCRGACRNWRTWRPKRCDWHQNGNSLPLNWEPWRLIQHSSFIAWPICPRKASHRPLVPMTLPWVLNLVKSKPWLQLDLRSSLPRPRSKEIELQKMDSYQGLWLACLDLWDCKRCVLAMPAASVLIHHPMFHGYLPVSPYPVFYLLAFSGWMVAALSKGFLDSCLPCWLIVGSRDVSWMNLLGILRVLLGRHAILVLVQMVSDLQLWIQQPCMEKLTGCWALRLICWLFLKN